MKLFTKFAGTSIAGLVLALGAVGCEPTHPEEIPGSANMVAEGNQDVAWTAPSRGMVYVYDTNTRRLVWAGQVDQGRRVEINRKTQKSSVDGNLVVNKLAPFDQQQIYFQPATGTNMPLMNPNPQPAPQPQPQPTANSLTVTPSVLVSPTTQPSPNQPSQNPQQ